MLHVRSFMQYKYDIILCKMSIFVSSRIYTAKMLTSVTSFIDYVELLCTVYMYMATPLPCSKKK